MTEKEKMLAGELYDANAPELEAERRYCRKLYRLYNKTEEQGGDRERLIRQILGKCGKSITILPPFYCDYGSNIEVGENFFANVGCTILDGAKVKFGDNVLLASHVGIYTAGHPLDAQQRNQGLEYAYPVTIGNNVWIGAAVTIVPGITIGDNCVIGAGSVVVKDIPANSLAVGNPCRVIRKL